MVHAGIELDRGVAPSPYDGFEQIFVGGMWREARGHEVSEDRDPYTGHVLVRIRNADERDLDEAFRAAAAAQPEWHAMLPDERATVLRRAAAIMEERRDEIVKWLIHESGSTRIKANVEWQYAHAVTLEAAILRGVRRRSQRFDSGLTSAPP